jgi:hypothetical protein
MEKQTHAAIDFLADIAEVRMQFAQHGTAVATSIVRPESAGITVSSLEAINHYDSAFAHCLSAKLAASPRPSANQSGHPEYEASPHRNAHRTPF